MKNILWIYNRPFNPEAGGTERITSLIMKGLSDSGHHCLGMLVIDSKTSEMSYQDNPVHDLSTFLKEKKVDVVINQDALSKKLLNVFLAKGGKEWHSQGGRLITCLHFDPKSPGLLHLFQSKRNKSIQDWITILKLSLFGSYYRKKEDQKAGALYKWLYEKSDYFVILSQTHMPYLEKVMQLPSYEKIKVINNPLTFPDISDESILAAKKNVLLVVARMDEYYKRISLVLKTWKGLLKSSLADTWTLKLVGDGPSLNQYKKYVQQYELQRVEFCGQQNPEPYYREAKIYMMTSSAEGWGLTLTESLQRGVVPVAMDSSPVFHEIIQDGVDGYLTSDKDIRTFENKILSLMADDALWHSLAQNALRNASRFSMRNTIDKWEELLS